MSYTFMSYTFMSYTSYYSMFWGELNPSKIFSVENNASSHWLKYEKFSIIEPETIIPKLIPMKFLCNSREFYDKMIWVS